MKQFKMYIIILLLSVLIIASVALAMWKNHSSWKASQNIQNSISYNQLQKQVLVECTKAKDCQDLHKNCYYSCSSDKCVRIQTFVALKPYPDCSSAVTCTPNWQCGWGLCVNGSQSQIAVDYNNCGLSSSSANIACPALAKICDSSTQHSGVVTRKIGDKEFNFLIQKINADSIDGLLYTLYPVAKLQGDAKTLHIGDTVGYDCEGKTATISSIDVVKQAVIFNETIKNPPTGDCPI